MTLTRSLAAVAALSLFACGQEVVAEDEGTGFGPGEAQSDALKTSKRTSAIAMKVQVAAAQTGAFATSFSIDATYDLFHAFDVPSTKAGSHVATYEIYMPSGMPYQRIEVPFAAGQAAVGAEVQADLITGGYRVWASMPVAGTAIQQSAITGVWSVKVALDGVWVASSTYTLTK